MSGPRAATCRAVVSSTAPPRSTAFALSPVRTSHGEPRTGTSGAIVRQLPDMPRWLRSTRPPSKRKSRFLPSRLDRFEAAAVESFGDPGRASAWVHGFDRQPLPDESSQPPGRAMDGVALRHGSRPEHRSPRAGHEAGFEQDRHDR